LAVPHKKLPLAAFFLPGNRQLPKLKPSVKTRLFKKNT